MKSQDWQVKQIHFRYSISYVSLFRVGFQGVIYRCPFDPLTPQARTLEELPVQLPKQADFAAFFDLQIDQPFERLRSVPEGILYSLNQTQNYFIDMQCSFEDYLRALSPKTRSMLKRKVRKFSELGEGQPDCRVYRTVDEVQEYYELAREVARRTYQEKLFQGALPDTEEFRTTMQRLAAEDRIRGFLLFLEGRPVAYLYIPINNGVAEYAYLGYDPEAAEHSPGTVLLYLALENLFHEQKVKYFDFGYGQNQTKQMFSTGEFLRADVYFFRKSIRNRIALYSHTWVDRFSEFCGRVLDRYDLRRIVKRWLRSR